MWADTILILFISICTALLGEGKSTNVSINIEEEKSKTVFISIQHVFTFIVLLCHLGLTWLMVYRTEKYQKLKAEVEKQSKKREFFLRYALYNA